MQEDILADMAKTAASGGFALGALLGSGGGKKFKALDVKRVYFGNWLRDYSQVCLCAANSGRHSDSFYRRWILRVLANYSCR